MMNDGPEAPPATHHSSLVTHHFRRSSRLSGRRAFRRVFDEGAKAARGPLAVWAVPNGLPHPRLGLSIGRRVGNAVRRNRLKRKLREAFRLAQHDLPPGHDLVVSARPHADLPLADYGRLLQTLAAKAAKGPRQSGSPSG